MLFVEFRFFWFFLAVFAVYWSLRENRSRKIWLLICSYIFYAAWNWKFLFLLMGSSALDYIVGMMLARTENPRRRRGWLILSLCANLGTIAFFKYYNFFVSSAAALLAWLGLPASVHTLNIIIPVGVSFYTFHSMSYTIDVYRGKMRAVPSILDVACFIGFFPQMVAGPIVRAFAFLPQLQSPRKFSNVDVRGALVLFLTGFIKKACIADAVAPFADRYFAAPGNFTAASAWVGVLFYAIQIYCDFSGYTDMAIACARLLGYELTINFRFPYFAQDISEFWQRWHISLSSWLRDYLYIPLGGNRGPRSVRLSQHHDHDAARRIVARRRVDVCDLGRVARAGAGRSSGMATAGGTTEGRASARPGHAEACPSGRRAIDHALAWLAANDLLGLPRVDIFPRRGFASRIHGTAKLRAFFQPWHGRYWRVDALDRGRACGRALVECARLVFGMVASRAGHVFRHRIRLRCCDRSLIYSPRYTPFIYFQF